MYTRKFVSNFYQNFFRHSPNRPADPADQFAWIERQLAAAVENHESVLILAHIPPGSSYTPGTAFSLERQWYGEYLKTYLEVVGKYKHVIIGQLFGHLHTDDLRSLRADEELLERLKFDGRMWSTEIEETERDSNESPDSKREESPDKTLVSSYFGSVDDKEPPHVKQPKSSDRNNNPSTDKVAVPDDSTASSVGALLLAPSVGATHGNNPSFRILDLISSDNGSAVANYTHTLVDYHQYVAHLHR